MDPMDVDGAPLLPRRPIPQNEPNLLVKQLSAEVCPGDQPPATVPEAVFVTHSEVMFQFGLQMPSYPIFQPTKMPRTWIRRWV
jgi:hypothetical protein